MKRFAMLFSAALALFACAEITFALTELPNVGPVVTNPMPNYDQYVGTTRLIDLSAFFADPDATAAARMTTSLGAITITLDGLHAPATVANFLNYVNSGRYFKVDPTDGGRASTFFHRSAASNGIPFVIQGGGYLGTVSPINPDNVQPVQVLPFPAVVNEPFISNTRGTIAMAKLGNNPNSATSQWFINMSNNSANLDIQNGGFTVFGHVTGNGLSVADAIAALPKFDGGGAFNELPVRDYASPNPVRVPNLVSIPDFIPASPLAYTAASSNPDVAIATASEGNLVVRAQAFGSAEITVTGFDLDGAGPVSQTFTVSVISNPVHLANIATRASVGTQDDALIAGFIVRGDAPKRVALRAIGTSLAAQGLPNGLNNPTLELRDSGNNLIASNDNWQDAINKQEVSDFQLAPTESNESVILATLPSNSDGIAYSAILRGVNGTSGIGLVEVYDLDSTGPRSSVLNISTRANVQTGDRVMIGGFIVSGSGAQRILVRAAGPSLAAANIANPLADPTLAFYDSQGTQIDFNDNWQDNPARNEIAASTLAPSNPNESAVLQNVGPGLYTAIVRGAGDTSGTGLVEVYALPPAP